MRNLKKILAMVLALVMSLSLMATAGAASFPDVDAENPYATAIEVLDGLKVFQGFEDGTFKPTDTLNRAQAAVLVYRIATGDVENKYLDNYTYMQQSKFNDLDGYNWAKGYINYCQNAGIVVGTSATTFNPGAPVTGYQLMVMLLRTLGYGKAGEFTDPKGWELQTAAIAEREGLLKNVTGGDFGAPAPRQMVAEILFRGLLHDTVAYSALTPGGYTNSGETLGKKNLGLEDISGVVMANEFADLEDDDTLADGKTRLDVDGKVYNLDIKSELTDIGEIRHAYVQNGTKVLTTLENLNDSTVNQPENGKGSKVSDLSKVNGDTQYFKNFGPMVQDESEWRIEYNVEFKTATQTGKTPAEVQEWFESEYGELVNDAKMKKVGTYEYTKAIKPGEKISAADLKVIRGIFDYADGEYDANAAEAGINHGVLGSVFAGANSQSSTNRNKNLAVEMTYSQFVRDYITNENDAIKSSDNGEWLKTIDNNGDGVADYVFLTTFVMSTVTGYNAKTETYTVEYDADSNGKDRKVEDTIKKSAIVSDEEELARDAVILYTWIDGKCYVSYPEVDTKAIDKKGIDYKKQTITCGDTTYEWSGIDYEAYHYYHEVSEAVAEVNYDLYKDHFGYVRLYKEATKGFVLLTDGFYATDRRNDDTYKAQIWDENAKELADIDVVDPGFNTANKNWFINSSVDQFDSSYKDDEGTWGRLNSFEDVYRTANSNRVAGCTPEGNYVTNIAIYDQSGEMYTLGYVSNATNRYSYRTHELAMDKDHFSSIKTETLYCNDTNGVGHKNTPQRINTTNDTVYYYVTWDTDKHGIARAVDVVSWTGYKNTPDGIALDNKNDLAYAVTSAWEDPRTTDGTDTLPYEIAEIVVIESEVHAAPSVVFPVTLYQRLLGTNRVGGTGYGYDSENKAWGYNDFEGKITAQDVNVLSYGDEELAPVDIHDLLKFYQIDRNENMWEITKNFADYNIHAGYITTSYQTDYRNYVQVNAAESASDSAGVDYTFDLETPIFKIGYDKDAAARKDHLLLNGFQQISVTGDVSSTFSSDELYYATDWDLGDKVIYMNDKNDGYFVINVTKSAKALWDNPDTAASAVGYQLLNLWNSIVADAAKGQDYTITVENGAATITSFSKDLTQVEIGLSAANGEPVNDPDMVTADGAYISKVPGTSGKWMLTNITGNVVITITGGNTSEIITELQLAYADYLTATTNSAKIDRLATALANYYDSEKLMSSSEKAVVASTITACNTILDNWANSFLTAQNAMTSKWKTIDAANAEAVKLSNAQAAAHTARAKSQGSTSGFLSDKIAAVKAAYAEAKPVYDAATELVEKASQYNTVQVDTLRQTFMAAYVKVLDLDMDNTAVAGSRPYDLLSARSDNNGTTDWETYKWAFDLAVSVKNEENVIVPAINSIELDPHAKQMTGAELDWSTWEDGYITINMPAGYDVNDLVFGDGQHVGLRNEVNSVGFWFGSAAYDDPDNAPPASEYTGKYIDYDGVSLAVLEAGTITIVGQNHDPLEIEVRFAVSDTAKYAAKIWIGSSSGNIQVGIKDLGANEWLTMDNKWISENSIGDDSFTFMVGGKKLTAPFNTILVNNNGVVAQLDNQQGATALRYTVSRDTLTGSGIGTANVVISADSNRDTLQHPNGTDATTSFWFTNNSDLDIVYWYAIGTTGTN